MKKTFTLLLAAALTATFTLNSNAVFAQSKTSKSADYTTALGLRLGWPTGITLKHFFTTQSALEGIVAFWYGGVNITGLYEYHMDIKGVKGLKWFVGGGLDLTSFNYHRYNGVSIGIDGIIGLDYKINSAPIDLSLDWKPNFYFTGVDAFYGSGLALSVRYTF